MHKLIANKDKAVMDVISHDVAPPTVNTDERVYSKLGWLIVLLGVCGFLIWAIFAPLDKGVPMPGTVVKEGNRKAVQHAIGGTIDEILVHDGDKVSAGQVLVRMNSVAATSQVEVARAQYISARTIEARLLAERDGLATIAFPPELNDYKADPRLSTSMALQKQLFSSRRMAYESEQGGLDENIAGVKSQLAGLQESAASKKLQLGILQEQVAGLRDLAKDGYIARNRLLDMERSLSQMQGALAEDTGNIGRYQRQITELGLRKLQRQQETQKEVRSQLSDIQREAEGLKSRLESLDYDLAHAEVKSPADGIVIGSNVFTRGGVVGAGAKLMEVVPSGDPLVVEGQLPVNLIDRVHRDLKVELIFSAFNSNKTPHIPGVVTQVSADRTVDERSGQPYYKVRAIVSPEGLHMIAKLKLDIKPGMPVEMFVKTGERTMMSYLLKPVFDRAGTSMTEE